MGADIHVIVEIRPLVEWGLPDRVVQSLRRQASEGDQEAERRLQAAATGPWVVGAALDEWVLAHGVEEQDPLVDRQIHAWWSEQIPANFLASGAVIDSNVIFRRDPELALPVYEGRSDALFLALTGTLRSYGESVPGIEPGSGIVTEPRGLPADACELSRLKSQSWEADGHSHSWVSAREVLEFAAGQPESDPSRALELLGAEAWAEAYGQDHVRWVFWFDN